LYTSVTSAPALDHPPAANAACNHSITPGDLLGLQKRFAVAQPDLNPLLDLRSQVSKWLSIIEDRRLSIVAYHPGPRMQDKRFSGLQFCGRFGIVAKVSDPHLGSLQVSHDGHVPSLALPEITCVPIRLEESIFPLVTLRAMG